MSRLSIGMGNPVELTCDMASELATALMQMVETVERSDDE